jgi:CRISPR/Cas system CMR subunit Cmr6 (Cas7 group RAMP superfamily)
MLDIRRNRVENSNMTMKLELPDDVLQAVHRHARYHGLDLSRSVTDLLRQALSISTPAENSSAQVKIGLHHLSGLPYVQGSLDAPATRMTVVELLQLENRMLMEDDLERGGTSLRQ